jgi:hypothetical protein
LKRKEASGTEETSRRESGRPAPITAALKSWSAIARNPLEFISLDVTETFDFLPDVIYHELAFVTSMMISHTLDLKYLEFSSSGTKRSGQCHSKADSSHGDQNNS